MISGGKTTDYRYDREWGVCLRLWDLFPYPKKDSINIVVSDMVAISLATAEPEINANFKTDAQCPIVWHFTQTSIANQGKWLVQIIKEWSEFDKPENIRIIWIPIHRTGSITNYATDIFEVADTMIKVKDVGKKYGISVRTALAKSWMPMGLKNQVKALKICRLNLALEVLSFNWIRCRCLNFATLTMETKKEDTVITELTRMEIPGFDDLVFSPQSYRNMGSDPMEISFYSGRKARQTIRMVFLEHGIEPKWERALLATDRDERVRIPEVRHRGYKNPLPVPAQGGDACHEAMKLRVQIRYLYERGLSDERTFPPTGLAEYPWIQLNAQSDDSSRPIDEYKQDPLSRGNIILISSMAPREHTLPNETRIVTKQREVRTNIVVRRQVSEDPPRNPVPLRNRLGPMLAHADDHTSANARTDDHTQAEKNPDQDWSQVLQLRDLVEAHKEAGFPLDTAWSDEMNESEGEQNANRSLDDVLEDGDKYAVVLRHKGEVSKIETKRGESSRSTRPSSRNLVARPTATARAARLASTIAARTIHREEMESKSKRSVDLQDEAGALVVRRSSEKKRIEPEPQKSKPSSSKKHPEEVTLSSSDDEASDTLESLDESSSSSESSSEDKEVKVRRVIKVLASIRKEKKKKKARKVKKMKAAKEKLDKSDDSKEKDKKSKE